VPPRHPARIVIVVVATLTASLALGTPMGAAEGRPSPTSHCPPVAAPVAVPFAAPTCRWCPGQRGLEYATAPGTAVRATAAGRVVFAGPVARSVWVVVLHADGLRTSYGPLAPRPAPVGTVVGRGSRIGATVGPLHLGARRGTTYVDPAPLLTCRDLQPRLVAVPGRSRLLPVPAGPIASPGGPGTGPSTPLQLSPTAVASGRRAGAAQNRGEGDIPSSP
jgi:hypothetical protein